MLCCLSICHNETESIKLLIEKFSNWEKNIETSNFWPKIENIPHYHSWHSSNINIGYRVVIDNVTFKKNKHA